MSKQHRDFVTYTRNGVEINALVAFSRDVFTPATQTEPALTTEHLTVVYLDPNVGGGVPTGEALRNSIKIKMDVPPLAEGLVNGWEEAGTEDSQLAFTAAVLWREYAVALETKLIHAGFPELPPVASEVPRTTPPTIEEINAVELVEAIPVQIETKEYADGSTATGVAPLPDKSPAEQGLVTLSSLLGHSAGDHVETGEGNGGNFAAPPDAYGKAAPTE